MKTSFARRFAAVGLLAAAFAAPASWQSLEGSLSEYIASIREMTAVLATARDPATAKAAVPRLEAAVQKYKAAGAKFQAAAGAVKPDDKGAQNAMQSLMPQMQAAMQQFGGEQQRVLANKDVSAVLNSTLAKTH